MFLLGTGPRFSGHAARRLVTILTDPSRLSFTKHAKVIGAKIENDVHNRYDNIINRSRNIDVNVYPSSYFKSPH